jgi:hypothetical protein
MPSTPLLPQLLDRVAVGRPITRGGVALVPVYIPQNLPERIATGEGAGVEIAEVPNAEVARLSATNVGNGPALLVEGETVQGGLQQRTLNVSVLVPGKTRLDIPVSCVEAGRWNGGHEFTRSRTFAPGPVRRSKVDSVRENVRRSGRKASDQNAVWSGVETTMACYDVGSATRNVAAADEVFERDTPRWRELRKLLETEPLPGQCGVVIFHGARVVAAELFGDTDLLRAHWTPLVRGHLLDAHDEVSGRPSLDRALRFLRRLGRAEGEVAPGVGLGAEIHQRSGRVSGQALVWEGALVHASAFALAA